MAENEQSNENGSYTPAQGEVAFEVLSLREFVPRSLREQGEDPVAHISQCLGRAKVPGGWFIFLLAGEAHSSDIKMGFFYPDPSHGWDGRSLPMALPD